MLEANGNMGSSFCLKLCHQSSEGPFLHIVIFTVYDCAHLARSINS